MNQELTITEYDEIVQNKQIQILKSILPFMKPAQQFPMALCIQTLEIHNAMNRFKNNSNVLCACSIENEAEKRNAMLQTIKKYCNSKEQETIDTILNIICVMENYENFTV